mmetsp:Transcript_6357/g.18682  ORF Transcript_6357/g.18682 Transcript_6357/m.18682 type:complete len:257 (+) Transcript_6357:169-939(+)
MGSWRTTDTLDVSDLSCLQWAPLPALVVSNSKDQECHDSQVLACVLLAFLRLWLGGPVEELGNITCLLRDGGRGSVFVLDASVVKRRGHRDGTAREVRVVVKTWHHFLSGRWLSVSGEEGEDVVESVVSGLDHETQVRRVGSAICGAAGLLVGVRARDGVVRLSWALEHFSIAVGSVEDVDLLGHLLDLLRGVGDPDQLTEPDVLERVAAGADLAVDLESASERGVVERGEVSVVAPWVVWRVDDVLLLQECDGCG